MPASQNGRLPPLVNAQYRRVRRRLDFRQTPFKNAKNREYFAAILEYTLRGRFPPLMML
jgi:hypothetical protein